MIAMGGPFLGAPKSIRGLISGERFGLEAFLSEDDGLQFARRIGSTPFLFPLGCRQYFEPKFHGDCHFLYLKDEESGQFSPISCAEALKEAGAELQLSQFYQHYMQNPLFGGKHDNSVKILQAPPIKRLICIYGYNQPTESKYFYRQTQKGLHLQTPKKKLPKYRSYLIDGGIAFETESTPQHFSKLFRKSVLAKSGDGSIPYSSLTWPIFWRDEAKLEQLDMIEVYGAEHRELLNTRIMSHFVSMAVCEREEMQSSVDDQDHSFKDVNLKNP